MAHEDHDEPVPIEQHHVRPRPRGGGDSAVLRLCANTHGRVHHLLDHIEGYAVACPYATMTEVLAHLPRHVWLGYSELERAIAYRGWEGYGAKFLSGWYATAYRFWATDGTAKQDDVPHFEDLYHASRWSRKWRKELEAM